MNKKLLSTRAVHQRERLLDALRIAPVTSHFARTVLDIYHPNARVLELRRHGLSIHTHWETIETGKAKHRVGKWVLLGGGKP
jgi:Helix-turn-helix domain